jgi:8-oxo-dGTP diphosphatase
VVFQPVGNTLKNVLWNQACVVRCRSYSKAFLGVLPRLSSSKAPKKKSEWEDPMPWQQFDQAVVHIVLCEFAPEGVRICLQRRIATGFLDGIWVYPGGRIELGENPLGAAQREAWEEVGVRPLTLRLVAALTFSVGAARGKGINFVYACHQWEGQVRQCEPWLHGAPQFYASDQLPEPRPPWISEVARRIASHKPALFKHYGE